jgi:hypothetical protein
MVTGEVDYAGWRMIVRVCVRVCKREGEEAEVECTAI